MIFIKLLLTTTGKISETYRLFDSLEKQFDINVPFKLIIVFVNQSKLIRHEISKIVRNQLRKMPELHFYRDDSFDYAQEIDKLLQ